MKRTGMQPRGTGTDTPCPRCARTFLVGPEFVFETHPTGRAQRSGRPIITVYVSPASVRSWGEDVLGRDDLPHGESAHIRFAERSPTTPCLWDVKFVYRGGTSAVSRVIACNGDAVIAPR